jgi:hypothetical protein
LFRLAGAISFKKDYSPPPLWSAISTLHLFSEEWVKEAIFGSYAEGAPGLDGFRSYFIKFSGI